MPEMRVEASIETLTLPSAVFTIRVPGVAETMVPRMWAGGSAAIAVLTAVAATIIQKTRARAFVALELGFIVVSVVKGNPRLLGQRSTRRRARGSASIGGLQHRVGSSSLWWKYGSTRAIYWLGEPLPSVSSFLKAGTCDGPLLAGTAPSNTSL
jgi:hypothetical protein